MKPIKKFWLQTALFLSTVIAAQIVIGSASLSYPDFRKLNSFLQGDATIYFFGDSVVDSIAKQDTDTRTISAMLQTRVPEKKIADISHPGYNQTIFEYLADYILRQPKRPEIFVIPVNMGIFSPAWDKPEYQFEKERFYLTVEPTFLSIFLKPLAVLNVIDVNTVTHEDYIKLPVYYGEKKVGTVANFDGLSRTISNNDTTTRNALIFQYMYALHEDHPDLLSLERTIDHARSAGVKVYIYVTPIDVENGQKYVGPDFLKQVKANVDLVCAKVEQHGAPCLDIAFGVRSEDFSPTAPHLNEKGRAFVAEQVAEFFFQSSIKK